MASLADLMVRLSGGAANTDPDAAIGGALSTAAGGRVLSQSASAPSTITGVTIDDAMGQAEGSGSLFYNNSAQTLRWTPPGGTAGTPVDVSADGRYAIQGGNNGGVLLVTVSFASLPSSDQTNQITITNLKNNIFPDVTKAQSQAGAVQYRGLYWQNAHATDDMIDGRFWMQQNTPGQDVINIANGEEAKNLALETLADENTAPAGPNFDVSHVDYASGIQLPTPLEPDDYKGFWLRRTVPEGVTQSQANNSFRLGVRVFV